MKDTTNDPMQKQKEEQQVLAKLRSEVTIVNDTKENPEQDSDLLAEDPMQNIKQAQRDLARPEQDSIDEDNDNVAPADDGGLAKITKAIEAAGKPYGELSKLKQRRALKAANKRLKRLTEGEFVPITHQDMLNTSSWDTVEAVYNSTYKNIMVTAGRLVNIIEHPALPEEITESDKMDELRNYVTLLVHSYADRLKECRKLHTLNNEPRTGVVTEADAEKYNDAYAAYNDIRSELVQDVVAISDAVSYVSGVINLLVDKDKILEEADAKEAT